MVKENENANENEVPGLDSLTYNSLIATRYVVSGKREMPDSR